MYSIKIDIDDTRKNIEVKKLDSSDSAPSEKIEDFFEKIAKNPKKLEGVRFLSREEANER